MTCDELRPDYLPFAMGVLEEPERSEVRAHLERGCDNCSAGLREARALLYAMCASTEGPAPPPRLRNRILAAAGGTVERAWSWSTAWQAAGAMALLAGGLFVYVAQKNAAEVAALREEVSRGVTEVAGLREAIQILQAPQTREVTFGGERPAPPRGRVFVNPSSGVLLIASNLPAPPPGKTYEMWIIPKSGAPAPAGLFASTGGGTAVHLFRTSVALETTGAVAVTLENAGGVNAPTTQPVIVAAL